MKQTLIICCLINIHWQNNAEWKMLDHLVRMPDPMPKCRYHSWRLLDDQKSELLDAGLIEDDGTQLGLTKLGMAKIGRE